VVTIAHFWLSGWGGGQSASVGTVTISLSPQAVGAAKAASVGTASVSPAATALAAAKALGLGIVGQVSTALSIGRLAQAAAFALRKAAGGSVLRGADALRHAVAGGSARSPSPSRPWG